MKSHSSNGCEITPEAVGFLKTLREVLASAPSFDATTLDQLVHRFVEEQGIKIGQIIHALRIATTGKSSGIGLFDAISLVGREGSHCDESSVHSSELLDTR